MKTRKLKTRGRLKHAEILQFTRKGKFLREYSSGTEAANLLGITPNVIFKCLKGKQKTAGGYQWRRANDPSFKNGIVNIPPVENNRTLKLQPVVQYNLEGKFVKEYSSMKEAAEIFGINILSILNCIRGKAKSANQCQWRLKKDAIKDGKIRNIEPYSSSSLTYLRPVCQFGRDGTFIREYSSIIEAAEKNNLNKYQVNFCVMKKNKTSHGYQWRRKEEVLKNGKITDIEPVKTVNKNYLNYLQAVCQFGPDGKFIREYPSIHEAAKENGDGGSECLIRLEEKLRNDCLNLLFFS